MRQAIITKYLGPTNSRQSRIKASCDAGSITVAYDSSRSPSDNHKDAIDSLRLKLDWPGKWHYGWIGDSMVAVCDNN